MFPRCLSCNITMPFLCPPLGTWPATQACARTQNLTGNPLVYRTMLQPTEPPGQDLE